MAGVSAWLELQAVPVGFRGTLHFLSRQQLKCTGFWRKEPTTLSSNWKQLLYVTGEIFLPTGGCYFEMGEFLLIKRSRLRKKNT